MRPAGDSGAANHVRAGRSGTGSFPHPRTSEHVSRRAVAAINHGEVKADTGRRYRLYPTPQQEQILTGWGHTVRAVWNMALAQRVYIWEQRRYTMRAVEQCKELTRARGELPWLAELPAQAAQQVLRQLDRAYDNFWDPGHPAGFPVYKKRSSRLSISLPGQAVAVRKVNRKWPRCGCPSSAGSASAFPAHSEARSEMPP
ncbi:transposase [Streptomyces sp. NPDC050315]|uniref:RNA-guided endonuclease InsQ/TnpB family protein n=1 Tax=Streptomyces sp. NPDC050315 TaxID=3155039 RepID=UPI00342D6933